MADSVQSLNRNRAIFIFAVGLVALVLIFLGGLWFSNERGDQLQKLATTDTIKTDEAKKAEEKPQPKQEEPKKQPEKKNNTTQSPPAEKKKAEQPSSSSQPKQPTSSKPAPQKTVPATGPQNDSLPKTGSSDWLIAVPILLVIVYAGFEYRRSRHAIQRAAYHENSGVLTLDS